MTKPNLSTKQPLPHYNIKSQFDNLLYTATTITQHYDNLILKIQESSATAPQTIDIINTYYDKIANKKRRIREITKTFRYFAKIYKVEKSLINSGE
ncbi:MAG: hypothetical protein FWE18_02635 [Alphaproteobacteria bacterium]|nr:hypothetical protein [Alphaproteobacteria bacterium]